MSLCVHLRPTHMKQLHQTLFTTNLFISDYNFLNFFNLKSYTDKVSY